MGVVEFSSSERNLAGIDDPVEFGRKRPTMASARTAAARPSSIDTENRR